MTFFVPILEKKKIILIGAGTANLFCAAFLDYSKFEVYLLDQNKTNGRKFLVAGDGGFNLTHSEPIEDFIARYTPRNFLAEALHYFGNQDLISFLKGLGIETFKGSSGRIYPLKNTKPIEVLKAIQNHLTLKGCHFLNTCQWKGWSENGNLAFENNMELSGDYVVFGLGGASWKVTGSDGSWLSKFESKGIKGIPFVASNCAFGVHWDSDFIQKNAGTPIKNLKASCNSMSQKGELVITNFGLEGNAIYGLSPAIRKELTQHKDATIFLDFKPSQTKEQVVQKLNDSNYKTISEKLKKDLKLSSNTIDLLKTSLDKNSFTNNLALADQIKNFAIQIHSLAPLDEAISTVGGIALVEVSEIYELKKLPNHFCIGEMLDWDTPTGGYLIQACASMGAKLALELNKKTVSISIETV